MCALHVHVILDATLAVVQVMYIACLVAKWLCVHCDDSDDNDLFLKQDCISQGTEANGGCVVSISLTSSLPCFLLQGTKVKLEEALDQVAKSTQRLESALAEQMSAQTAAVQLRTSLEDSLAEVRSAFLPQTQAQTKAAAVFLQHLDICNHRVCMASGYCVTVIQVVTTPAQQPFTMQHVLLPLDQIHCPYVL